MQLLGLHYIIQYPEPACISIRFIAHVNFGTLRKHNTILPESPEESGQIVDQRKDLRDLFLHQWRIASAFNIQPDHRFSI